VALIQNNLHKDSLILTQEPTRVEQLTFPTNTRLGRIDFHGTNAPAYIAAGSVTKKKSLLILTPGVNVIKLFPFITDDEAK